MTTGNDSLRLVLISLNELKQVAVLAANGFALQLHSMGVVKGKKQLETFLEMAGVDHYVVSYAEPFANTFKATPFDHNAKQIVAALEKAFRSADELRQRVEKGEKLSDEEQSQLRFLPRSWTVWSSSVKTDEGMERVKAWFKEKKSNGRSV